MEGQAKNQFGHFSDECLCNSQIFQETRVILLLPEFLNYLSSGYLYFRFDFIYSFDLLYHI